MIPEKLMWVLTSRKFWASVLGVVSVIGLALGYDELPADQAADLIVKIIAVYVGSIAVEDGLSRR